MQTLKKRKGLQIDSDSDENSQSKEIATKKQNLEINKSKSSDISGNLNKKRKNSSGDHEEKHHKSSKDKKKSVDEISELFESDHTDQYTEINQIKEELEKEKQEKIEKEKARQKRRQERKEREEREEREREERRKEKEQRRKEQREQEKQREQREQKQSKPNPATAERTYTKKDKLVYDFLIRWWYALPEWPPVDYDYKPKLDENKLYLVDGKSFRRQPPKDNRGFDKVMEIEGYRGCFRNEEGKFIDLRPEENKPSYNNMKKKSESELKSLLKTALEVQVEQLKQYLIDSEDTSTDLLKNLQRQLKRLD